MQDSTAAGAPPAQRTHQGGWTSPTTPGPPCRSNSHHCRRRCTARPADTPKRLANQGPRQEQQEQCAAASKAARPPCNTCRPLKRACAPPSTRSHTPTPQRPTPAHQLHPTQQQHPTYLELRSPPQPETGVSSQIGLVFYRGPLPVGVSYPADPFRPDSHWATPSSTQPLKHMQGSAQQCTRTPG